MTLSHAEVEKIEEAAEYLRKVYPRIGRKSILDEIQKVCCRLIPQMTSGSGTAAIAHEVPKLLGSLDVLESQTTTVYVQVAGIDLKLEEWSFGPAKFMHGNHPELEGERSQIRTLDGMEPSPLDPATVVVQMKLAGETDFAKHYAGERIQKVLDCVQFLSLHENRGSWDAKDLTHFGLFRSEPIPMVPSMVWSYSSKGPTWTSWHDHSPILCDGLVKCVVDANMVKEFSKRGGDSLAQLLMETNPSAFDDSLMTSVNWIANGIRERDLARKYLSYFIALEALFIKDNKETRQADGHQSPIVPIGEGVAFLLGKSIDSRRSIKHRIDELAGTRHKIVHRGFTAIDRADLISLGNYSWNACWQCATKRNLFNNDNSFHHWLLERKFGNADLPESCDQES
ncbi:MAG: hypothetical protein EBS05_12045 [Proteobacteria bacterium]|nr:hypothetical protein [Pseudomonadota bacterium]